jgi:hypothetical protein
MPIADAVATCAWQGNRASQECVHVPVGKQPVAARVLILLPTPTTVGVVGWHAAQDNVASQERVRVQRARHRARDVVSIQALTEQTVARAALHVLQDRRVRLDGVLAQQVKPCVALVA